MDQLFLTLNTSLRSPPLNFNECERYFQRDAFHSRGSLSENNDLELFLPNDEVFLPVQNVVSRQALFYAPAVPELSRAFFLEQVGFTHCSIYKIQSAFRGSDGDILFGFRIERESYQFREHYDKNQSGTFVLEPLSFYVYASSRFFYLLPLSKTYMVKDVNNRPR